ncbi:MAG: hypothetical protein ABL891_22575 [Burkholderiales bacterium]
MLLTVQQLANALLVREKSGLKYPDWDQPLRVHSAATAIYAALP